MKTFTVSGLPLMSTLQRVRRGAFLTLLLVFVMTPAQATDPLTLYLLKMLRDQMATSMLESAVDSTAPAPTPPAPLAGVYGVSEEQLRDLIDAGFVHLAPAQRAEVHASLIRMLADPKNALARPMIIEELAQRASVVRGAHERLAALTEAEKHAIAADARAVYEGLPPREREQLLQLLRARAAPIPGDLNDLILAEFTATQTEAALIADRSPMPQ